MATVATRIILVGQRWAKAYDDDTFLHVDGVDRPLQEENYDLCSICHKARSLHYVFN